MRIHELKCWPEFFEPLLDGRKRFEWRINDRDFHAGDILHLREWSAATTYSGRELYLKVDYILTVKSGEYSPIGIPTGYAIMSVSQVSLEVKPKQEAALQ